MTQNSVAPAGRLTIFNGVWRELVRDRTAQSTTVIGQPKGLIAMRQALQSNYLCRPQVIRPRTTAGAE